jgi:hypothetical protein
MREYVGSGADGRGSTEPAHVTVLVLRAQDGQLEVRQERRVRPRQFEHDRQRVLDLHSCDALVGARIACAERRVDDAAIGCGHIGGIERGAVAEMQSRPQAHAIADGRVDVHALGEIGHDFETVRIDRDQ